jgi:organic radical activating enzyme
MNCWDSVGNIKETPIQEVVRGPELSSIREHMMQGQWHTACRECQKAEQTQGASARTVRRTRAETLAAIVADPVNYFVLEHIVVNWSNLCNLTCVYCNSDTSTAWQSIKGIPINHVKNEHPDLIRLAQEHGHSVVGLSLGGGEPLLQRGLLDFLRCLKPDQVRVMVTTNLSIDLVKNPIYNELRTWPYVDWQISFDNADPARFEYVRNGADWNTFVANIHLMKQHSQKVIAHPAYSIYCAFDLINYYEFCAAENLDVFWCELTNPWDLDVRRYPEPVRKLAREQIDQVVEQYGSTTHMAVHTLLGYQRTLLDNSYLISPEFRPDPVAWHTDKEQELNKAKQFLELWPEYAN